MNGRSVKMNFSLVLMLFLFIGVNTLVLGQNEPADDDKRLREEILSVYQAKGEQGLRYFVRKQKDKIPNRFVTNFANAGVKERSEERLKICEIMAEEKKDEKTLADVLYQTGQYFRLISESKRAIDYFDKALSIYLKLSDQVGQGNVYAGKGIIYSYTGDNSRALELYDKALPYFEKAGFTIGQGNIYLSKGEIYFYTGVNSNALEMYDKALLLFKKAGDPLGQGNVYLKKGNIYLRVGDNSRALEMYDKALPYFEKAGVPIGQGNVYLGKGDINSIIGDNSKALEMYDKALFFFEKAGAPTGLGNIYLSKGEIYFYTGDNSRAIEMYDKALHFFKKTGTLIGQGNVYLKKGNVYLRAGDNSRAIEMYDKALPFFQNAGELIGQGNIYKAKGDIYFKIGENSKALEMYDKALPFFEKTEDTIGQGNVYLAMGIMYFYAGDNSKSLEMYDKALLLFEKAEDPVGQGNVYQSMGDIYFYTGDSSKAFDMYNKSLTFYLKAGDIESESNALQRIAKVMVSLGKGDKALDLFEKAIAKLEKVRIQTVFIEMKRTFMEKVYKSYEETVIFMLENKYYDKGFKYAESMRARVFLDQMAEGLVKAEKGLKTDLKEERDRLVGKLSALSRQMQETGNKEEKKLKELKEEYRKVESEFEDLLIKIRLENPLYGSVNYPQPVSVRDLQKDVLKKGETLLSYFISEEKSYAFIITKNTFNVIPLKVKGNELKGLVDRYLPAIKENNTNSMKRFGNLLYEKLFTPLEKYLDKDNDIIIVPMGELETIPFESLVVDRKKQGRPAYLLEKYRLKYVQGATLLSILRKYYTRDNTSKSFIGFGDPVYDYENFTQNKPEQGSITRSSEEENSIENEIKEIHRDRYARGGGIMNRLPHSGEEVQTIARLFEKESLKNVIHLREQATEENAKGANMKDFDYIHFSCHSLLNDDFQSLVLSQLPPDKSKEDGYFTLNEIMNCDYNAKLVVLSACETGKGKMYRGEGLTGLTRAVMYAGTPAVVASLWKVDDTATKELMVHFYQNMLEKNMDKVEALRQAKLQLLKTETYSSPYFWSAFVMYGE